MIFASPFVAVSLIKIFPTTTSPENVPVKNPFVASKVPSEKTLNGAVDLFAPAQNLKSLPVPPTLLSNPPVTTKESVGAL